MPVAVRPLRFVHRGRIVEITDLDPNLTVLNYLRLAPPQGIGSTGTKEGCASGDCGACAVVVAELESNANGKPGLRYRAVNSCIRALSSIEACALWTCHDIAPVAAADTLAASRCVALHPVQQALVDAHGSQCGFCTPGFVMSLYALYAQRAAQKVTVTAASRDDILLALSGNLCRCTGYRPIIDAGLAACALADQDAAAGKVDSQRQKALALLRSIAPIKGGRLVAGKGSNRATSYRPRSVPELLALRAAHPDAQLIAGSTDVGVWQNKQHRRFLKTLDVSSVADLHRISQDKKTLTIGAAARLTEAFAAMVALWPQLAVFTERFAGLTIRNSATLGGNIANGSPIGDSMPLLIALDAQLKLASATGQRVLPIEQFFTAFRQTALAGDEIISQINIPKPRDGQLLRAYKVSKRFEDDISTVSLALQLHLVATDRARLIKTVRIGAGGVAATPVRAFETEQALLGQPWNEATVAVAAAALSAEFAPIDDQRGSAAFRRQVIGNLLWRCWHERDGRCLSLDTMRPAQLMARGS